MHLVRRMSCTGVLCCDHRIREGDGLTKSGRENERWRDGEKKYGDRGRERGVARAHIIFVCHGSIRRAAARRAREEQRWVDLHRIMEAGLSPQQKHYRRINECPHQSSLAVLPLVVLRPHQPNTQIYVLVAG